MNNLLENNKSAPHILMVLLVFAWGFEYVPAKWGLGIMTPLVLLFWKYLVGILTMLIIFIIIRQKPVIRKKHILNFVICAIFGELMYFGCEYSALNYMPVSLVTIILGFVPVLSIILERVLYKRKANQRIIIGIIVCTFGVALVIGADFSIIFQGRGIGYILAFLAVIAWNVYNFITSSLQEYDSVTITFLQILFSVILIAPIAIHQMPPVSEYNGLIIAGIVWLGVIDAGVGFLVYVYCLKKIGPTSTALYSDFVPVTSTFFGAILLHESITHLQVVGGIVVVAAAFVVIREKGKLDEARLK